VRKEVLEVGKTKEQHYTEVINKMLQRELEDLKKITAEVESLINASGIDIDLKAIRVLETMQKVKFDTTIFRELQEMKR